MRLAGVKRLRNIFKLNFLSMEFSFKEPPHTLPLQDKGTSSFQSPDPDPVIATFIELPEAPYFASAFGKYLELLGMVGYESSCCDAVNRPIGKILGLNTVT